MAFKVGQTSTFEFDVLVLQFLPRSAIEHSSFHFSSPIVALTLFVSRFNFVVRSIQLSSQLSKIHVFDVQPQASQ